MVRAAPTVDTAGIKSGSWTGTSFVADVPTAPSGGWVEGDIIIVAYRGNIQGANAPTNAAFARRGEAHTNSSDARTRGIVSHVVTSAEAGGTLPSTYTFSGASGTQTRGVWVSFTVRGADLSSPFVGDSTAWSNPSGNTIRTSIANVSSQPALVIMAYGQECTSGNSSIPGSTPSGSTEIINQNHLLDKTSTTGTRTTIWVGGKAVTSTGATGNLDLAFSNTAGQWGAACAIYGADVAETRTATGGVTLAGTADVVEVEIATASSGVTLSGSAAVVEVEVATASSGVTLSGSAAVSSIHTVTATGGVTLNGTASSSGGDQRNGIGTFTLSGTAAPVEREIVAASSGVTLGGTAAMVEVEIAAPVGTVTLGGSTATVEREYVTATGGVTLSGTAPAGYAFREGFATVADLIATPGATIAHRNIATNFPPGSEFGYDTALQAGYGALEFSCGWTSDLVPFGLGPQYLDSVAGVSGNVDPTTMTWAHLSANYEITVGSYGNHPFYKLEDFLAKYTPTHVVCVDPKFGFATQTKIDEMLDLCDAYGGPTKIIIKFDSPETDAKLTTSAHARGYTCMNYWGTNTTAMAAEQSRWELIGALYSSSSALAQANTYGKPSWGAVIPDQSGYNTARSYGADICMISNVLVVAPVTAGIVVEGGVTLSGTATAIEAEVATASSGVTLSGTAAGVEREIATGSSGITLGGSGAVVEVEITAPVGTVTLGGTAPIFEIHGNITGTGIVTLSGSSTESEIEAITASGGVTLSGTAPAIEAEITTASSGVTLSGSAAIVEVEYADATGTITLSGAADGNASGGTPSRTATGTVTLSGSAAPVEVEIDAATGGITLSGTAPAFASYSRTATSGVTLSGSADAIEQEVATATSGITLSGAAVATGSEGVVAVGTITLAGAAASVAVEYRTASSGITLTGSAGSVPIEVRAAEGSLTLIGTAETTSPQERTATGTLTLSGVGETPAEPDVDDEGYPHMPYPDLVIDNQPPRIIGVGTAHIPNLILTGLT